MLTAGCLSRTASRAWLPLSSSPSSIEDFLWVIWLFIVIFRGLRCVIFLAVYGLCHCHIECREFSPLISLLLHCNYILNCQLWIFLSFVYSSFHLWRITGWELESLGLKLTRLMTCMPASLQCFPRNLSAPWTGPDTLHRLLWTLAEQPLLRK